MYEPEALKIRMARLLNRRENHGHQGCKHDVAGQTRSGYKVSHQKPFDPLVVLDRKLGEVVPVRYSVGPREEDNGPCHHCGR